MEQVPMNDGLDGRETIAFGLGAAELAALVVALITSYAVLRSGLPAALAWLLAALVAGGGALLGWGRLAGRPVLEWSILLVAFLVRTAPERSSRVRARVAAATAQLRGASPEARARLLAPGGAAARGQAGAVVVPLALRRLSWEGPPPAPSHPAAVHPPVVGFFSLAGGTGRTTLAVEVAAILAVRGRAGAATGGRGRRVVLLDLAARNPAVGLRLGLLPPPGSAGALLAHSTGLLVGVAPPAALPAGEAPSFPTALVEDSRADVVIVDFDCDLSSGCAAIVARCDQVLVTTTATANGVLDAYRSTALLRRLGARERIGHVRNRCRPGVDLGEVMADLGGAEVASVPEDACFVTAEDHHRLVGLDSDGEPAAALHRLAACIEERAGLCVAGPRWGSNSG